MDKYDVFLSVLDKVVEFLPPTWAATVQGTEGPETYGPGDLVEDGRVLVNDFRTAEVALALAAESQEKAKEGLETVVVNYESIDIELKTVRADNHQLRDKLAKLTNESKGHVAAVKKDREHAEELAAELKNNIDTLNDQIEDLRRSRDNSERHIELWQGMVTQSHDTVVAMAHAMAGFKVAVDFDDEDDPAAKAEDSV